MFLEPEGKAITCSPELIAKGLRRACPGEPVPPPDAGLPFCISTYRASFQGDAMKSDRLVIGAVVLLAGGLGLLLGFTHGATSLSLGYPFSATTLHLDLTTAGIPVLVGVPLVAAGTLLLVFAMFAAIAAQFHRTESEPFTTLHLPKRNEPFGEFGEGRHQTFAEFEE